MIVKEIMESFLGSPTKAGVCGHAPSPQKITFGELRASGVRDVLILDGYNAINAINQTNTATSIRGNASTAGGAATSTRRLGRRRGASTLDHSISSRS